MSKVPRLRNVLLLVNLMILLLPLGGIVILKLYETELVRRTENELIVQGTLLGAAFKEQLLPLIEKESGKSDSMESLRNYGLPAKIPISTDSLQQGPYHPIMPNLDLSEVKVLPPAPAALTTLKEPDILAVIAAQKIMPIMKTTRYANLAGARVVDYQGIVVASTGNELGKSLANRKEVRKALEGKYYSLIRQRISDEPKPPINSIKRRARMRVFVAIPVTAENRFLGAIVLSRTVLDISKALYFKRKALIVGVILILLIVVFVSALTSRTISHPMDRLIKQARRIAKGDKNAAEPLSRPGTQEVANLSESMTDMARTLQERAEYIRTFASHVSHEFKGPIASIKGTVELLFDHLESMDEEKRERFLKIIDSDAKRLEQLVNSLVDMAKADVVEPKGERSLLHPILDFLQKGFERQGVNVSIEPMEKEYAVGMDSQLFESIMTTLLNNAKQHGGQNVSVSVQESFIGQRPSLDIVICDDGPGISSANSKRIFEPFFTTAKDKGGSGLGLYIVRKILSAHDGDISLDKSDRGSVFRIKIPGS